MLQSNDFRALPCPACGSITSHTYLFHKNGCEILRCAECGLGRAEGRGFEPAQYYTQDYFSGGHADGYANYLGSERVLRREFARTVRFIRNYCDGGRLLELGCAYGFFLQEARGYFDAAGIELAEDAAAHCRRSGLRVLTGAADDAHMNAFGSMDVIVMLDVIEHMPAPHETLALCARHLRPGGIVVLTTGDFDSALARRSGAGWRLMTPPQHLWFFSAASIERLAARLGMHLEALDHPWKIVPASLILFQLGRMLGFKRAVAAWAGRIGIPVNLLDVMRVVLRLPAVP
jgi:SAM-dependent methyltransferase